MSYLFAFDLETTGISVSSDRPMQIAYSLVRGDEPYQIVKKYVNPDRPCNPIAQKVHGITEELAKSGITLQQLGEELMYIFDRNEIVGALGVNVLKFDIPLLYNSLLSVGIDFRQLIELEIEDPSSWYLADHVFKLPRPRTREDHRRIHERFKPKGTRSNLSHLCEVYNISLEGAHDAGADLDATIKLWQKLRKPEFSPKLAYTMERIGENLVVDVSGAGRLELSIDKIRAEIDH